LLTLLTITNHFCTVLFFGLHRLAAFYKSFSNMRKIRLLIIIEQYTKDDALQKEKKRKKKKERKKKRTKNKQNKKQEGGGGGENKVICAHCMKEQFFHMIPLAKRFSQ